MTGIVYVLENKLNGKVYIGQTVNLKERMRSHSRAESPIGRAIRKYGFTNFVVCLNEVPEEMMDGLEKNLIRLYGSLVPCGYNLTDGGQASRHHHALTKEKLRRLNPGRTFSPETRKKMSQSAKAKPPASMVTRQRIADANRGKPGTMAGKHHTAESKRKMSEARSGEKNPNFGKHPGLGRRNAPEIREKMRQAALLRWQAAAISGKKGGWHHNPETKEKIRRTLLAQRQARKAVVA